MADPKKSNALNDFLMKFGEKLALGVAVLLLLGYAIYAFGMSSEDPSLGQVKKGIDAIEKEGKNPHKDMMAPDTQNWQAGAVGPWNTVVTTARPPDDWGGFIITKAEGKGVAKAIIKKIPVVVPPVAFGSIEVAIDSITVTWSYKDFTPQEVLKMGREKEKIDAAKASHFVLEREVNGNGKWEVIAEKLDVKVQSYIDTKIEPKTKYAYKVTAYSTDKNYLERGGKVDPVDGATSNANGKINVVTGPQVSTLGIWKLTFTNPSKPADAAKGMVYVKIEKFEKGYGKVEKAHIHYDGDQIGFWEESAGAEPVSKHRVATTKGKTIEVDFNIGATLISVNPVKLVVDVKRCKPIFDKSTGVKTGCDQIIEKRNYDTSLIVYKDDEGQKKIYSPNPGDLNQLCEEHGGKKTSIVTTVPGDKPANPDEPKVDPKEVARMKKEADAEKLFDDAEKALEKNKSLAASYYQKLLAEYKDTDFVSKNKKAIIEERLAGLKSKK